MKIVMEGLVDFDIINSVFLAQNNEVVDVEAFQEGINAFELGKALISDDVINIQAEKGSVETIKSNRKKFNRGSLDGFLDAISHVSLNRKGS